MVTLPFFTTEQAYLGNSSESSLTRVAPPSKAYKRPECSCSSRALQCSFNKMPSLQPFSRVLRCGFKVCAVDPSLSSSSVEESVELEREEGMPIPGTITFRRSATQRHYEYVTNLESLGMEIFSSGLSRSVALSMGFAVAANSDASSTPTSVSIDVTKEGRDLRLNGIVRTALALICCRCGVPVGERVFGEFSLLLTEKPIVEPTKHRIGVVLGDGVALPEEEEDLEEVLDLDLDDKLHFPKTEKSIDISKYIRDTVHLEIPILCVCTQSCRGRCIECGKNLNKGTCNCGLKGTKKERQSIWGPLDQLKKQLESEDRS